MPSVSAILFCVLMIGCAADRNETPPIPRDSLAGRFSAIDEVGTERMVEVLDAIRSDALRQPMEYYYLNRERAQLLRGRLEKTPSGAEELHLRYVRELLFGGETEKAIGELEGLLQGDNVEEFEATPETKPIVDLLAGAYMHLGIQENCAPARTKGTCIFPLTGEDVFSRQAGPRSAIVLYEEILSNLPTDFQSRWLMNVAYMMIGEYPEGVPEQWRIDGLRGSTEGPVGRFENVAPSLGVDHRGLSGGVSVEDFTNDGFLDILVTSYGLDDQMRLYASDGAGGFVDRTESAGLEGLVSGLNTVHADYDNDGDEDVFVLRGAWLGEAARHPNSLLQNDGDGTFTDVTYQAGLDAYHSTQTAAWRDFNGDGWIDLFVGNESSAHVSRVTGADRTTDVSHPSALYLNNGDGTFTNVARKVGLELDAYVKGASWGDVNGDGRPDLYVSVLGGANRLYVNRGGSSIEDWQFDERASEAGVEGPTYSFPTWFWDYNNDGHEDLFVGSFDSRYLDQAGRAMAVELLEREGTGISQRATRAHVYRNNGDGTFTEVAESLGLDKVLFAMGSNYGDLDNDGYQDLYVGTGAPPSSAIVPNRMFRNRSGQSFEEVSYEGGFAHIQKGHAVGFGDFDRDGDQDIYSVIGGAVEGDVARNVLFENPGHGNSWITLDLVGRSANRSAIGARIRIVAATAEGHCRVIHRTVSTGGSFGASSLQQEVGLGDATHVDTLQIEWPTQPPSVEIHTDLGVNQTLRIVEGRDEPEVLNRPAVVLGDSASERPAN